MKRIHTRFRIFAAVAGMALLAVSGFASADPPSRVARLGYASGAISFSPAGEEDWVQATINRPLTTGDRLWADAGARAEVQVGGAMIRMNAATSVAVLNLDDTITQLQLTQGTLNVSVRRLDPNQVIEIDTPNLAFTVRQPGDYRIMVDAEGNATSVYVRKGQGEVYGEGASYVVDSRQPYRFTGTGLTEYEPLAMAGLDDFDRWAIDRDSGYNNSISARYVSPDVVGYQDLDGNGTWRADATYGNVWFPNRVEAGWAPYRDGHWAWVDPWGWTWVDDAPWGFAVSHYGRWASVRGTWGWIPGPVRSRAYYAPALVAFVGGNNFSLAISSGNVGGIAWFPLGPREVYRPSYAVSRRYFENVNVSNTVINTTVINNYYNNSNVTNVTYVNRQVPGAIVAVPTTAFVQSQPVNRSAVRVTQEMVANAPVASVAAVAPTDRSVRGAAAQREKPPARAVERPVVAHATPPVAPAGFAAQRQQLAVTPGKPLDDAERKQLKTDRAATAAAVRVIAQPKSTAPTALPPAATATNRPEGRGNAGVRKDASVPPMPGAPAAAAQGTASTPVASPASAASQAAEARAKAAGSRGKDEQRVAAPAASPPPPARVAVPAAPGQPQAAAPKPVPPPAVAEQTGKAEQRAKDKARSDEQRAKQEQRQQEEQRVRAAAAGRPPSAPQAVAPAPPAQTQMAAPVPPPQRSAQPRVVTPPQPQDASNQPQAERRAKPEPTTPVARQTERRPPGTPLSSEPVPAAKQPERVAAPPVAAAKPPAPEARAPKPDAPSPEAKAARKDREDKKKEADEEERKQKG